MNVSIDILSKAKNEIDKTKIRNRWEIFNILINEPEANLNNMMIDLMIANLTINFEFILKNAHCKTQQRKIPNFNLAQKRVRRSVKEFLKKFVRKTGKYVAWSGVLAGSATVGTGVGVWLDHKLSRDDYSFAWELEHSCKRFNYGCHNELCWSNCGIRTDSSDWCFTKSSTVNSTQLTPFGMIENVKTCNSNEDCSACAGCASECFTDIQTNDNNNI